MRCGRYKTAPEVYGLVGARYGVAPEQVSFQSSNRWDVAGATKFGFRAVWINRAGAPDEYRDLPPGPRSLDARGARVDKKRGRRKNQRPKSREETPKEGCSTSSACATVHKLCCDAQNVKVILLRRII